ARARGAAPRRAPRAAGPAWSGHGHVHGLFVTGIPYSWDKEQLKDTFLDFSIEPLYVDWFQKATGEFLGHAVVEVATQEDGEAAVNMINDFEVEGADGPRKLVVRIDTKAPHLAAPRAGG
ncbi:unnamed protein product, partial [Prorocentrum cordatum]